MPDHEVNRSAETGQFVTAEEAAEHPETTVTETVRPHMTREDIARTTYNVNRAYCEALGDHSFGPWEEAPEWQKVANRAGVNFHLCHPDAPPSASHESWFAQKLADGWTWGSKKDPEKKEHPCMVPFEDLPADQRVKDYLFKAVVESLRGLL
jgi:hypothetical protein